MLKTATDGGIQKVKFANWDFALAEFQREVDDLLSQQQRETALLGIKRASLERLTKYTESGEQVLSEMHPALAVANKRRWNRRRWTWSAQSPRAKTALVEPSTRA